MMIKVKIIKPPIPILFIDTFFFIDLVKNRHSKVKKPHFSEQLELIDLIHRLTKQEKLLCPQGDQGEEYELGQYEGEIREEQVRLSYGISATYHYGVHHYQIQQAIMAYLKRAKEVVYDYKSLFQQDPLKELREALKKPYIVSCHIPNPKTFIDKRKKTKNELAEEFEKLRQEKLKLNVKFSDWVRHETLGTLDAIINTIKAAIPKIVQQQPLTKEETNGLQILGDYLAYYSHYSKKNATPKDVADFLRSDYYATVPYISIQAKLFASLLTQSGKVKRTDNFDFHQTSQMLPFSSYFLTDSSLMHRLTTRPLLLDKEYGVKVYCMREIKNLIQDLSKL